MFQCVLSNAELKTAASKTSGLVIICVRMYKLITVTRLLQSFAKV